MGKRIVAYRVWMERPEGKNHLEDLAVDGTIILKRIWHVWGRGKVCTWFG